MMNGRLATSGNVPLGRGHRASQPAGTIRNMMGHVGSAFVRLDRRAQRFFNQQAQVRSRKVGSPKCGWKRYDSYI